MDGQEYHRPVLVDAVMTMFSGCGAGLYLDGTLGGGGHAEAILRTCGGSRVLGVDRDPEALEESRGRLAPFVGRVRFLRGSFEDGARDPQVAEEGLTGAILDLGVSSHQLDADARGFTMRPGAPLDMRMDASQGPTAADLLAKASQGELTKQLKAGDAPRPGALARRIVERRSAKPIRDSDDLVGVLSSVLGRGATHAEKARLFQALRIAVNDELGALERTLPLIRDALRPGGTLVVISYHSLEDGIVKRAFREWSDPSHGLPAKLPVRHEELPTMGSVLTRKPVRPSEEESRENPRAKPARLRAWRRAA